MMVAIRYLNDDDKAEFCHIPIKSALITKGKMDMMLIRIIGMSEHIQIHFENSDRFIAAFTALVNWKEGDGILDLTQYQQQS